MLAASGDQGGRDVVARFHGGHLGGQVISHWPQPPAPSVWAERADDGVIATEQPAADEADPEAAGFDRYTLFEVVSDLAVYHLAE
jgi:hypothetical protein